MKLIEKKCPNCGAELKFDKDSTEVKCNYCDTSYIIQKDADLNSIAKDIFDANDFILHRKMISNFGKGIIVFSFIVFIFIFVMFLLMFFRIAH